MWEIYEVLGIVVFVGFVVVYAGAWLVKVIAKEIELWRK